MNRTMHRRSVLRGMLGGMAITVGTPFLECFLNSRGTALANGMPLPVRFGTWTWALGMNSKIFTPDKVGPDFDLKHELAPLAPIRKHVNLFSRYRLHRDGRPSLCHYTGWVTLRCGEVPTDRQTYPAESIDVIVADAIAGSTRFRSLEMAATGNRNHSTSFRSAQAVNPPEVSPINLYQRIFGPEFQDPNSADFRPNPDLMLRKSVLSAVREDAAALTRRVGAADRARLDEYFTSLRGLEQSLALQLQKPPPAAACRRPQIITGEPPAGTDSELIDERHRLMTDILVAALTCNQTRVFNMAYSYGPADTTRRGVGSTHHTLTHEEQPNEEGYQPEHSWFIRKSMGAWAYFVGALASVREGDRTLLDNTLIYAHTDQDNARIHSERGIPMMTAGSAGGRVRSGIHFDGRDEALATEVGLSAMQAMGLSKSEWGWGSMRATKPVSGLFI